MAVMYQLVRRTETNLDDQLRLECGWTDVARGLRQIVLGYLVLIVSVLAGAFLVVASTIQMGGFGKGPWRPTIGGLWQFYLGLAILGVAGLFCWGVVLAGKFKCLLNAPERHGARWLMFLCLSGTLIGPTFNFAARLAFTQQPIELKRGARGLVEIKLNQTGRVIQLIGFAGGLLSPLAFLLFLRAVARCLERKGVERFLNGYVAVSVGLMAMTGYLVMAPPPTSPRLLPYLVALGLGWLVWGAIYLMVAWLVRGSIFDRISNLRSPLEASA
jgi:hypothetical protein